MYPIISFHPVTNDLFGFPERAVRADTTLSYPVFSGWVAKW
jgi:hypothetical protein